ncbi:MAG: thiamine-phosphate kinase [Fibromonadaceae bacterium]|jgi:thiamine-monophosphate kinase|nr:thiamine-phosphate kinase [Fibromonadaceae bacterium]
MFTSEFKFINNLLSKAGDDAFVFGEYLIAADMSVEGTHFRLDWSSPSQAIEKCLLSNFSDINAMGGVPCAILFSVCINKKWSKKIRDEIASAVVKVCKKHKVKIWGGDTTGGALGVFSIAVFGKAAGKVLLRSTAKAGDDIWVSGFPGKSKAGFELLKRGGKFSKQEQELVNLHKVPQPPLGLGRQLAKIKGIGACIDTSDSLAESLLHISQQSKVRLEIENQHVCLYDLHGGEDYELLFTAKKSAKKNIEQLAKKFTIHKIGEVKKGNGSFLNGKQIKVKGWQHFP